METTVGHFYILEKHETLFESSSRENIYSDKKLKVRACVRIASWGVNSPAINKEWTANDGRKMLGCFVCLLQAKYDFSGG